MRVLLLTKYGQKAASSRHRFIQYILFLDKNGIQCTVYPLFEDSYLVKKFDKNQPVFLDLVRAFFTRLKAILKASKYDLVMLHCEVIPYFPCWLENYIKFKKISYIYDADDAIFHQYDRHQNWFVRRMLGQKISTVMRNADLVIVGNEYLAKYARKSGSRQVEILPTVVDLTRYTFRPPVKESIFTIGWIGSPSTSKYLKEIAPALAEICRNGQTQVTLIGSGQIDLPGVPITILPWSETTEVANIQGFDVGIMPLPDAPWERGKCGFKLIQYMACGLPVVASPVGVNSQIVEAGVNGFLATTIQEWVKALKILINSPNLREQMGKAGRQKVESEYCLEVTAPKLVSLLYSLCQDKQDKHET